MRTAAILLAAGAIAALVYLPLCDLVFDCGCTWPLRGDWQHCDIHVPGPPDCPVCAAHPAVAVGAWALGTAALFAALRALSRTLVPRARA